MPARDFSTLRKTLSDRRNELQERLTRIHEELRDSTVSHADSADRAVASTDLDALHEQAERAQRQMRQLDDALRRMDAEGYGVCAMCGQEIAMARLKALPWARYCVECQDLQEEGMLGR